MLDKNIISLSPEMKGLCDAIQILYELKMRLAIDSGPGWDWVCHAIRHLNKQVESLLREAK